MKKKVAALILLTTVLMTGCGDTGTSGSTRISGSLTGVQGILEQEIAKEDAKNSETTAESAGTTGNSSETTVGSTGNNTGSQASTGDATDAKKADVDLDLTELSSTMVYTEVYNMVYTPEDYIGKKIRMEGPFMTMYDEANDFRYYACLIQDATACCAQGLEFVLDGEYIYPRDYPEEGTDITVVGEFDTYMEGEYRYCTLRHASIEKIEAPVNTQAQP